VLGIPGFTGWYGLKQIGRPKSGETLVVSGAAGATGSLVVQMGKILGCRVVGTAGTDHKCAYVTGELGADAAINYKTAGDMFGALREACPKGIDIYFENVGGPLLDMVLRQVNPFARIPLCGMISQYNLDPPDPGPRYLFSMIGNRVHMQGFIISDHLSLYPEFLAEVEAGSSPADQARGDHRGRHRERAQGVSRSVLRRQCRQDGRPSRSRRPLAALREGSIGLAHLRTG
jgi:NADPH-dependent curcumin reductase CurA